MGFSLLVKRAAVSESILVETDSANDMALARVTAKTSKGYTLVYTTYLSHFKDDIACSRKLKGFSVVYAVRA